VAKDPYWMWAVGDEEAAGENPPRIAELAAAGKARMTPSKEEMRKGGPDALLDGWRPETPFIGPETRVIAIGSCFAAVFAGWLADNGYNRGFDRTSDTSLLRNPLESPGVVAQQFRWAFGEFDSSLAFWFTPEKQQYAATEERREQLRRTLCEADVVVITLGLAETWVDAATGEPVWRVPPREVRDRYAFKVATVADCLGALTTIDRLRREHMPNTKIVYTLSPVRFRATFRPIAPIVANTVSKAILRATLEEFLAGREDLNETYFYFPSYEIVTQLFDDPFEDNMHVRPSIAELVVETFARNYTTLQATARRASMPVSTDDELRATIERLEADRDRLQRTCDERLAVIEELQAASEERLELIERLTDERTGV
jgi:hypothetical protein